MYAEEYSKRIFKHINLDNGLKIYKVCIQFKKSTVSVAYLDEYWPSKVKQMLLGLNLEQREFVAMTRNSYKLLDTI